MLLHFVASGIQFHWGRGGEGERHQLEDGIGEMIALALADFTNDARTIGLAVLHAAMVLAVLIELVVC